MCHRAGSVVVDFSVWMDSSNAESNKLRNILVNQEDFKIKGFVVDRSSIRMSGELTFLFQLICSRSVRSQVVMQTFHFGLNVSLVR